jgi:thiol-disulfide isomerase/thioredoxin
VKPGKLVLPAVGLIALAAGALLFQLWQPTTLPTATPAQIELHSIPLTDLDGQQTLLSDWQAEILIINFWAPWCAPCRREIPALIEIQNEYEERGVRVLGLAFDGEEQVRKFAAEYGIDYPLFLTGNRSGMYNVAFSNPSGSLPYTTLLSPKREIVYQHNGEVSSQQLREQLEAHLQPAQSLTN